ncbi:hypothetical protein ACWD7M_16255 [Streptomyces griseus]
MATRLTDTMLKTLFKGITLTSYTEDGTAVYQVQGNAGTLKGLATRGMVENAARSVTTPGINDGCPHWATGTWMTENGMATLRERLLHALRYRADEKRPEPFAELLTLRYYARAAAGFLLGDPFEVNTLSVTPDSPSHRDTLTRHDARELLTSAILDGHRIELDRENRVIAHTAPHASLTFIPVAEHVDIDDVKNQFRDAMEALCRTNNDDTRAQLVRHLSRNLWPVLTLHKLSPRNADFALAVKEADRVADTDVKSLARIAIRLRDTWAALTEKRNARPAAAEPQAKDAPQADTPHMVATVCSCGASAMKPLNGSRPACTHNGETRPNGGIVLAGTVVRPATPGTCYTDRHTVHDVDRWKSGNYVPRCGECVADHLGVNVNDLPVTETRTPCPDCAVDMTGGYIVNGRCTSDECPGRCATCGDLVGTNGDGETGECGTCAAKRYCADGIHEGSPDKPCADCAEESSVSALPTLTREPWRGGQYCGHQTAYGMPGATYCAERKAPGKVECAAHVEETGMAYGVIKSAPGNAVGLILTNSSMGRWSVRTAEGELCASADDRAELERTYGFTLLWEGETGEPVEPTEKERAAYDHVLTIRPAEPTRDAENVRRFLHDAVRVSVHTFAGGENDRTDERSTMDRDTAIALALGEIEAGAMLTACGPGHARLQRHGHITTLHAETPPTPDDTTTMDAAEAVARAKEIYAASQDEAPAPAAAVLSRIVDVISQVDTSMVMYDAPETDDGDDDEETGDRGHRFALRFAGEPEPFDSYEDASDATDALETVVLQHIQNAGDDGCEGCGPDTSDHGYWIEDRATVDDTTPLGEMGTDDLLTVLRENAADLPKGSVFAEAWALMDRILTDGGPECLPAPWDTVDPGTFIPSDVDSETWINLRVRFTPQDPTDTEGNTRPCMAIGTAQVYGYREGGRLIVGVEPRQEGDEPMEITVNGNVVFTA